MKNLLAFIRFSILLFPSLSLAQSSLIDASFNTGNGFSAGNVRTILPLNDGNVLVGGSFGAFNSQPAGRLILLNEQAEPVEAFNANLGSGFNGEVYQITRLNSGKLLVCGDFTELNGAPAPFIVKLNPDGSRDNSFSPEVGANNRINAAIEQSDGKLIIGGRFTAYNGTSINRLARLNTDGSLDFSFNNNGGAGSEVLWLERYNDDRFLAGGNFININGTPCGRVARLLPDGTVDPGFITSPNANATVQKLKLMDDGKIIIAGFFTQVSGNLVSGIARLLPDGAYDSTFNPTGTGASGGGVLSFDVSPDGHLLIGGSFTAFNGLNTGYLLFLSEDGIPLSAENTLLDSGPNWNVLEVKTDNAARWLVGGLFSSFSNQPHNRIIRLLGGSTVQLPDTPTLVAALFPNPASEALEIHINQPIHQLAVYSITGQICYIATNLNSGNHTLPLSNFSQGLYLIKIQNNLSFQTLQFVKQ